MLLNKLEASHEQEKEGSGQNQHWADAWMSETQEATPAYPRATLPWKTQCNNNK